MEGVQMGNHAVMFGSDTTLSPFAGTISYTVNGSAQIVHLIADLQPNHSFSVTAGGTPLGTITSSGQGTLSFTNTALGSPNHHDSVTEG